MKKSPSTANIKVGDIIRITYGDYLHNGIFPDRYAVIVAPLSDLENIGKFFGIKMLDNMEKTIKLTVRTYNDRWFKVE